MHGNGDTVAHNAVAMALDGVKLGLIAESYNVLKSGIRVSHDEMRTIFADWNRGELADPRMAAAADVLGLRDEDGDPLLEKVLDVPCGSSLCKAAACLALDRGIPSPMITQAAFLDDLSRIKDERIDASAVLSGPKAAPSGDRHSLIEELRKALVAAFILAYAEAFALVSALSDEPESAARALAEEGSPISASAAAAKSRHGSKESVLLDASVKSGLDPALSSLRRLCSRCAEGGIHAPLFAAALSYYDGIRSTWLPSNMVAALRDSREGTGYERIDRPRGETFHSAWK
jgi:6-phosphogluconate dehydrogenase